MENLSDPDNATLTHHINQAIEGPRHHEAGHRLRGEGRRGHHRGRVHRPSDVRPPVLRRPAPGHRGQGSTSTWQQREQDPGHHHLPELLPPVRQAVRYDRYRHDRGRRSSAPSTIWTSWRSPPTAPTSVSTTTTWSTRPRRASTGRSSSRSRSATTRASPCWWVPCPSRSPSC